jgi:hypothetical protein
MAKTNMYEKYLELGADKSLVEVIVGLSLRDRCILEVLSNHYGTDISEVVRMLLRQKAEQMPQFDNDIVTTMMRLADEQGE